MATGASESQLATILFLFINVPLSLVFPYLPPSPSVVPHLYSIIPAVVELHFLNLDRGTFELFLSCLATWVVVKWGVNRNLGRALPWTVFVMVMGHLAVNHIRRHLANTSIDEIEITGSQMVICMKLTSFAWSVYDGIQPDEELDNTQRSTKITKVPDLIPFLGYCAFFPSIIAGPTFAYSSYAAFTSHALYVKETGAVPSGKGASLVPEGRRRKAAKRFLTGVFFLAIYSVYGSTVSYFRILEPKFANLSFPRRVSYMQVAGFVARTKYYSVWCIAESAFILSGLGYSPITKKYDASRNIRIRSIELAPNFKILLDSWNMNTNVWLRECIYKRVARKGRKPGFKSAQITFITSALWHGVNPCYLMTFVLGGFCQSVGRGLRRTLRPLALPAYAVALGSTSRTPPASTVAAAATAAAAGKKPAAPCQTPLKWSYDIAGIVVTQLVLNFAVAPFLLLTVEGSIKAWRVVNYYGLIMVFVPFALLHFGGAKYLQQIQKRRVALWQKRTTAMKEEKEKEAEEERLRVEWERREEEKRRLRGEGLPSMGLDMEAMLVDNGSTDDKEDGYIDETEKKKQ